jgi:nucleotide-binding universal stress UspA family protein
MPKTILVPIDGSPQSQEALAFSIEEFPDATLHLLHVIDPVESGYTSPINLPGGGEEWYEAQQNAAEKLFAEAREQAVEAGMAVETTTELGRPATVIVEYAENDEIDGIVMGSHGRSGVSRILLGSVAETVVRRSPVPVTVVR